MSRIAETGMPNLFGLPDAPPIAPDRPRYPGLPGHKGDPDGPSAEAAKIIGKTVTGRRAEVLNHLRDKATAPMTADEIAVAIGRNILSVRPRVSELHAMGLIEPVEQRGKNESGMSASRWQFVEAP